VFGSNPCACHSEEADKTVCKLEPKSLADEKYISCSNIEFLFAAFQIIFHDPFRLNSGDSSVASLPQNDKFLCRSLRITNSPAVPSE
jgi:hypothetical protein